MLGKKKGLYAPDHTLYKDSLSHKNKELLILTCISQNLGIMIVTFSCSTQQGMNEENGKRDGATTTTSDIARPAMLQHREYQVLSIQRLQRNLCKKSRNFLLPRVKLP